MRKELNKVRELLSKQICSTEQKMAEFLVKTPYVLLLSVTGIHIVSAAGLVGEAGPIEHYATAAALNGRGGLFPSRYQSDGVDCADGALARHCNRKLRSAQMLVAEMPIGRPGEKDLPEGRKIEWRFVEPRQEDSD